MIAQCPSCGTRYTLDDRQLAGRARVQGRCAKCHTSFTVTAPPKVQTTAAELEVSTTRVSKPGPPLELPAGKKVALSITGGPSQGRVFRLTRSRVVLGREDADIVLDDPSVSKKHCVLEVHGKSATLVDLDTTNGTFVDDQRIEACELDHLSEFRIGATTLLFSVTEDD